MHLAYLSQDRLELAFVAKECARGMQTPTQQHRGIIPGTLMQAGRSQSQPALTQNGEDAPSRDGACADQHSEYKSSGLDDEALGPGIGGQPPQADELRNPTSTSRESKKSFRPQGL
eukprot:3363621-Amphidinium_carterae.3